MNLEAHAVDRLDAAAKMLDQALGAEERPHSGARQHAAKCPVLIFTRGGDSEKHLSIANGQRAWKRQPAGIAAASGTVPSIAERRCCSRSRRGIEPRRPMV